MALVLGIDAGTTGVRSVAVDKDGRTIASHYQRFPQHFPRPGWVEHEANDIWQATRSTLAQVVAEISEPVATIGITNQRETIVAWDATTSLPLARAIVWQDRRTTAMCEELTHAGYLNDIRNKTGLVLDPCFSATKLRWLLNEGGLSPSANLRLGTIDSWLVWKLTGGAHHVTDVTNASRTMLFNLDTLAWDDELLELFEIPKHSLGKVVANNQRIGVTANTTALGSGVPISGIAGDQQASLFGQACFRPGLIKNTYGTGSFVLMNLGEKRPQPVPGLLTTVAWSLRHANGSTSTHYAMEGSIFSTGATVEWLRDGLGIIDSASELEALAKQCAQPNSTVLVPAFAGLGSPWWDASARGAIVGITRGTSKAQLARAAIDAMVFQTRDIISAMTENTGVHIEQLRVDGGASVMNLLLELQADHLGVPVLRSTQTETTVRGAVFLAGLAEGVWRSLDELEALATYDFTATPTTDETEANVAYAVWLEALSRIRTNLLPTKPPQ